MHVAVGLVYWVDDILLFFIELQVLIFVEVKLTLDFQIGILVRKPWDFSSHKRYFIFILVLDLIQLILIGFQHVLNEEFVPDFLLQIDLDLLQPGIRNHIAFFWGGPFDTHDSFGGKMNGRGLFHNNLVRY